MLCKNAGSALAAAYPAYSVGLRCTARQLHLLDPGLTMKTTWLSTISLTLFFLAACGADPKQPAVELDLVAKLKARPSLTKFSEALETTGVAATLQADGSYTVFVPMDVAVADETLDQATVRHHILEERVTFSDLAGENVSYTTLNTDEIDIDATGAIKVGDGFMVESDITASNGVIHVIDKVLTPSDVATVLSPAAPNGPTELAPPTELPDPIQSPTDETDAKTVIIPAAPIVTQ